MLKGNTEFLGKLRDLCRELGSEAYDPSTVRLVKPTRALPSDQPLVSPDGRVIPTTLVGKLVTSEWNTLLASALFFEEMARSRSASRGAISYLPALLLLPVFFSLSYLPVKLFKLPLSTGSSGNARAN
jgi:hypothetical protein